jgi:hypothetical protein
MRNDMSVPISDPKPTPEPFPRPNPTPINPDETPLEIIELPPAQPSPGIPKDPPPNQTTPN